MRLKAKQLSAARCPLPHLLIECRVSSVIILALAAASFSLLGCKSKEQTAAEAERKAIDAARLCTVRDPSDRVAVVRTKPQNVDSARHRDSLRTRILTRLGPVFGRRRRQQPPVDRLSELVKALQDVGKEELAAVVSVGNVTWKPGQVLRVRFMDGSAALQQKVLTTAGAWSQFANVSFVQSSDSNAEIRVSFFRHNTSWSYLGRQSLRISPDSQTMSLGWLRDTTPDSEIHRVALHEFGHALGLIHEHQQPAASIPWDTSKVLAYYADNFNWPASEVFEYVIKRESSDSVLATQFDSTSIMEYAVPATLTKGGYEIGWHAQLSDLDKAFIAKIYPRTSQVSPPDTAR